VVYHCTKNAGMASKLFIIGSVFFLAFVYFSFDPALTIFFPQCPFYKLTGYLCPGCGSQRAVHQLLHGNFSNAIRNNALLVGSLPFGFYAIFLAVKNKISGTSRHPDFLYNPALPWVVFFTVMLFWVLRNSSLSVSEFLSPP
jgi:prolipoprotein diacylglyceryltransferase